MYAGTTVENQSFLGSVSDPFKAFLAASTPMVVVFSSYDAIDLEPLFEPLPVNSTIDERSKQPLGM